MKSRRVASCGLGVDSIRKTRNPQLVTRNPISMNKFRGTGVALVTPFTNSAVDFAGLERVINHCISGGVEYLVSLGTTGESATLNPTESLEVLEFTSKTIAGRVPLVAGFGGNNTQAVIDKIKAFHFEGVDAILSVSPYYNKPTQEGIYRHYMVLAEVAPRPIIIYNVPSRTGSNIAAETTLRLAHASKKFIAVKEASGNLIQCMNIVKNKPDNFLVLSGDDAITLPMLSFGIDGLISVVANAFPRPSSDMVRHGLEGNFKAAAKLHFDLLEIMDLLFVEGNPAGVKAALDVQNICSKEVRLPLAKLSEKNYIHMKNAIEKLFDFEIA